MHHFSFVKQIQTFFLTIYCFFLDMGFNMFEELNDSQRIHTVLLLVKFLMQQNTFYLVREYHQALEALLFLKKVKEALQSHLLHHAHIDIMKRAAGHLAL